MINRNVLVKTCFFSIAACVIVGFVLYLAGVFFFLASKTSPRGAGIGTWLSYWSAYSDVPAVRERLIKCMLAAVAAVAIVAAIVASARGRKKIYGDARWANFGELNKAGLFASTGIVLGVFRNKLLRFAKNLHVLVVAESGAGKTAAIVMAFLLTWRESAVVIDPKGEGFLFTSWFRKHVLRQEVFYLNPFSNVFQSHAFNPLDSVRRGTPFALSDLEKIAFILWPNDDPKQKFWNERGRDMFIVIAMWVEETGREKFTLPGILQASYGYGKGFMAFFKEQIGNSLLSDKLRNRISTLIEQAGTKGTADTFSSIKSTFNAGMSMFNDPMVAAAVSRSDFELDALRRRRMTVYFRFAPDRIEQSKAFAQLLFSTLISVGLRLDSREDRGIKVPCALLCDEARLLGRMEEILTLLSLGRSYLFRVISIYQSWGMIWEIHGKDGGIEFATGHKAKLAFGVAEPGEAEYISKYIGQYTATSISKGTNSGKGGGGSSTNRSDVAADFMLVQDILRLPDHQMILLVSGVRPALVDKCYWYSYKPFWTLLESRLPALENGKKRRPPTQDEWENLANEGRFSIAVPAMVFTYEKQPTTVDATTAIGSLKLPEKANLVNTIVDAILAGITVGKVETNKAEC